MKRRLLIYLIYFAIGAFLLIVVLAVREYFYGDKSRADFFMKCAISFGTLSAVLTALFGDSFRQARDAIRIEIRKPAKVNLFPDRSSENAPYVYCHHLAVVNRNRHGPVEDCQVWLERLFYQSEGGAWKEMPFAVPRLMEWSPAEYSRDKRTFADHQLFDLGETIEQNGGFRLKIWREQGGFFSSVFNVGEKLGLVFAVTANNYERTEKFCVEIGVDRTEKTHTTITPADVSVLKRKPQWLKEAEAGNIIAVFPSRIPIARQIVVHRQKQ